MQRLIKKSDSFYVNTGDEREITRGSASELYLDNAFNRFTNIPTIDAQEALKFCQTLNQLFVNSSGAPRTSRDRADSVLGSDARELLSVVIPIYNEDQSLPSLYSRLTAVLNSQQMEYEIIFVDDGSTDRSQEVLNHYVSENPRVTVLELARNFGHQTAITAGLDHAQGSAVVVMDGDLQDPPEALPQFVDKWREGYDCVYAIRERRKEHWLKRTAYTGFYRVLRLVANIDIPLDSGDFCIMDRRVVDLLSSMPERNRFVRGIRSWVGLRQVGLPFERAARHQGRSKYTIARLLMLALDGLISFSYVPLRFITFLGFGVSALSLLMALFYFVKKLLYGLSPPGFATLVVSSFLLAGIQLITLGVIGEYVGRIFEEAKRRPLYVLRNRSRSR